MSLSRTEAAKGWGSLLAQARKCERRARWMRRMNGWGAVLIGLFALLGTQVAVSMPSKWNDIGPIVQLLIVWLNYRSYLRQCKHEKLWREFHFHAMRMWVETETQAQWHSCQMDLVLEKIKRT